MKIKLFTHTDLDGIGCAILAYLAFGRENVDVEYCNYDNVNEKVEAFIEQEELFKSYDKIYITDINVSEDVANLIDILDCPPKRVRLFDHHATALWLNRYEWCEVCVELNGVNTCGTEMFWTHLVCYEYMFWCWNVRHKHDLERFVLIVRDYDTWRWKELGEEGIVCKQVNDIFYMYGREEFITWAMNQIRGTFRISPLLGSFPEFSETDKALLDQKQKDIDRYIEKKDKQLTVMTDSFGYTYGVIFAEQYFSELGNRLCEQHLELDYIAMIDICGGKVSYRTVREDLDVGGTIAHSFGGGGHPKAAGSTFDGCGVRELVVGCIFIPDEERERFVETINDVGETYPISAENLKKAYIQQF